jgi:hypothetical protein
MAERPRPDGLDDGGSGGAQRGAPDTSRERSLSRRTLLKGLGLGAVGVSAASLLEACGAAATPTAAPASIAASAAPSAAASAAPSAAPSAVASAVSGGTITIGFITPQTGNLAGFASGDSFIVDHVRA